MLKVNVFKQNKIFTEDFLDCMPSKCEGCGSDLVITESLLKLQCVNIHCDCKVISGLYSIFKQIGVKNITEEQCNSIKEKLNIVNVMSIFNYDYKSDGLLYEGCTDSYSKKISVHLKKTKSMRLWEFIELNDIDTLRGVERKLFKDYVSLEVFYKELKNKRLSMVDDLLGIESKDALSVKSLEVYNSLLRLESYFKEGVKNVDLLRGTKKEAITICVTSNIGKGYKDKSAYISDLLSDMRGTYDITIVDVVTDDCDALIWCKEGVVTTNVVKAKKYGIPIINGKSYKDFLMKRSE